MAVIELPIYGIVVKLPNSGGGSIESDLHRDDDAFSARDERRYNSAIDGLEALILAHACAGIDIEDPKYIKGIETALDAIANM